MRIKISKEHGVCWGVSEHCLQGYRLGEYDMHIKGSLLFDLLKIG